MNITDFGASPSPGDDTAAIQKALDAARSKPGSIVRVPAGTFDASTLHMYGDTTLEGVGDASVIKGISGAKFSLLNINQGQQGSDDPNKNYKNITVRKLTLKDRVEEGNRPHRHLFNVNAATNVKVHDVLFSGYMGDAIYLGSGMRGTERHNLDISITNNRFDGVNRQNRNAISIIDGTRVLIADNSFKRSSEKGPAVIDIEPNKFTHHWVQDVTIDRNTFEDGRAAIKSDVYYPQDKLEKPYTNIKIRDNKFTRYSDVGIQLFQQNAAAAHPANNFVISGNTFTNVETGMRFRGLTGVQILNNTIQDGQIGVVIGPTQLWCSDFTVMDNKFFNLGDAKEYPEGSAIVIRNADKIKIVRNQARGLKKNGAAAPFVYLQQKGKSDDITIEDNDISGGAGIMGTSQVLGASPTHKKGGRTHVRGNRGGN